MSSADSYGLFSGFEHYATPTDDDYRRVMESGLVVLDANALLNLYRYTARARAELLNVVKKVAGQVWEPNQVIQEFWHGREAAIHGYDEAVSTFTKAMASSQAETVKAIGVLGNRVGLDEEQKTELVRQIEVAYVRLSSSVADIVKTGRVASAARDTTTDPVIRELEPILRGRVGGPPDDASRDEAIAEAKRRSAAKEPPGYKDESKTKGHPAGDYLVWTQILEEAASRGSDLLFVTGDVKEDWWRKTNDGQIAGPRFELIDEFHNKVGRRLYMLKPATFLKKAAHLFSISVNEESISQAVQVDQENRRFESRRRRYENLENLLLPELRLKAAELGIRGVTRMSKFDLIAAIQEHYSFGVAKPTEGEAPIEAV